MKLFLLIVIATMLFPFLIGGVSASTDVPNEPTTASDTHFFVGSNVSCSLSGRSWLNTDCWSHTSGGVGGAGVPTSTNAVVFDGNSPDGLVSSVAVFGPVASAASITTVTLDPVPWDIIVLTGVQLVIDGNVTQTASTDETDFKMSNNAGLTFGGTISGANSATFRFHPVDLGEGFLAILTYTGPNSFGTASNIRLTEANASLGPTIYCFPGCEDGGLNVNIVFSAPPVPCSFPFGTTIDILIPILITASLLLLLVVILIGSKESSRSNGTSFSTIFLIINLVIIVVITAALIPNIQVC